MKIGTLELENNALLAPMAGVTDHPFRLLCREKGCAYSVTEMVSAKGFLCAPENGRALEALLLYTREEGPVGLQIFGHEPDVIAEAIRRLEALPFAAVDLNMGCPAHKIVSGGEGSALLKDLPLCRAILTKARKATRKPFTVKMRLGWAEGDRTAYELARIAEDCGADAVTVHGRTRDQFYAGSADWDAITQIKKSVGIPVIGNGDIDTAEQALFRMRESGCDAVMIGRGAMGNPWIFEQIACAIRGETYDEPSICERVSMLLRHSQMMCDWKGEKCGIMEMRKHAAWYLKGIRGAAKVRPRLLTANTMDDLRQILMPLTEN